MSKYTTELRFIAETEAGYSESQGFNKMDEVMIKAREKIFSFDYPVFDPAYRPTLEYKIMRHYWTQEICEETYSLWKLRLQTKLNEIMPYYNKLYMVETLQYDPLYDQDYYEKRDGTSKFDGAGTEHSESAAGGSDTHKKTGTDTRETDATVTTEDGHEADNWSLYNDTPQGGLNGVKANSYLTTATNNTADESSTGQSVTDATDKTTYDSQDKTDYGRTDTGDRSTTADNLTTDDYLTHVYGRRSYAPDLILRYRQALMNIDMMIIDELEVLFMGLW